MRNQNAKDARFMARGASYGGLVIFFLGVLFYKETRDKGVIDALANALRNCTADGQPLNIPIKIDNFSLYLSVFLIIAGAATVMTSCMLPWGRMASRERDDQAPRFLNKRPKPDASEAPSAKLKLN